MKSLPLFVTKREMYVTLLVLVVLFFVSLSYEFYKYKQLTTYSLYSSTPTVLSVSKKEGKNYSILKLKSDDFTFFTTSKKDLHIKRGDEVKAIFYTDNIDFIGYLRGFYASSKLLQLQRSSKTNSIINFIYKQHNSDITKELYGALFFALPISKKLRADIAKWGISHLVAISGFHLGILSAILFFLLKPIYTFFQNRYFPYRNRSADLAFMTFMLLGLYVYFLGMGPSVLRAFIMSIICFFLFSKNIKIISFSTLFFTISIILILYPYLVFSIAFWFSVSGVFYIFLFLHHFSHLGKTATFVLINFWVFILMLPIVHFVFDTFSFYQFYSPIISMIFVLFYPLSLILHMLGEGGVMDNFLLRFLNLHIDIYFIVTPTWFFVSYILMSIISIRFKSLSLLLLVSSLSLVLVLT